MSPIRRYLRITRYSVLEVRIYLDKPSDAAWLLSSRDPVLTRIIDEIRPLVLPRLREENENAKRKGGKKKKNIKDVVTRDDFEVTIFLTELSTRHSLLTKQKTFSDKPKLKSTGNKLTGWLNNTSENPIHVDDVAPGILREEEDEDAVVLLRDIPEVGSAPKRKASAADAAADDGDRDALFVSSDDEEAFQTQRERRSAKRQRGPPGGAAGRTPAAGERVEAQDEADDDDDDKKKLGLNTSYDGFSIYGRILCLLIKRRGHKAATTTGASHGSAASGSQMMEQWVSTQAAQEGGLDDDD